MIKGIMLVLIPLSALSLFAQQKSKPLDRRIAIMRYLMERNNWELEEFELEDYDYKKYFPGYKLYLFTGNPRLLLAINNRGRVREVVQQPNQRRLRIPILKKHKIKLQKDSQIEDFTYTLFAIIIAARFAGRQVIADDAEIEIEKGDKGKYVKGDLIIPNAGIVKIRMDVNKEGQLTTCKIIRRPPRRRW